MGNQSLLRNHSVFHYTKRPASTFINCGEISTLDTIFLLLFLRDYTSQFPPISLSSWPHCTQHGALSTSSKKLGGKVDSLLMAENQLAARLPRQLSNNEAEQALRQRIPECTKYIEKPI